MAEKKGISVWDAYNDLYNRGMKKGKNGFTNWVDNILHPEKSTRFSLGHLWHGKESAQHKAGSPLYSFKKLFGVKSGSGIKAGNLFKDIVSKGSILHDYTKYNKSNPDDWKDSESNLMSILEHEGKKYAKFVNKKDNKDINLYELKGEGLDFNKTFEEMGKKEPETGMNFKEGFEKVREQMSKGKIFKATKGSVLEMMSDKGALKDYNVNLTAEGRRELREKTQSHEKKKKGLKAGLAIASDLANTLQSAWERSYRG